MGSNSPIILAVVAFAAAASSIPAPGLRADPLPQPPPSPDDAGSWIVERLKRCFDCAGPNETLFEPMAARAGRWDGAKHWLHKVAEEIGEEAEFFEEGAVGALGERFKNIDWIEEFLKIVMHCFRDGVQL